jgi:hypothetical protein
MTMPDFEAKVKVDVSDLVDALKNAAVVEAGFYVWSKDWPMIRLPNDMKCGPGMRYLIVPLVPVDPEEES